MNNNINKMENYFNKGSSRTPLIYFDSNQGSLEIKGRSIPENSTEFYKPLNEFIDSYLLLEKPNTVVTVFLDYFNTNSLKCIFNIFKQLESLMTKGCSVTINWNYEDGDEDMLECGKDFQSVLKIPFVMNKITTSLSA